MNTLFSFLVVSCLILPSLAQNCQSSNIKTFFINSSSLIDIVDSDMQILKKSVIRSAHPAWTANIQGAQWIWSDLNERDVNFGIQFYLNNLPSTATLKVAVDNFVLVFINNTKIDKCTSSDFAELTNCDLLPHLALGQISIMFKANDFGGDYGLLFSIELVFNIN